jgi:hypothetical protein
MICNIKFERKIMADHFITISEDGVRFRLHSNGTWEPDAIPASKGHIRFRSSDWGDSMEQVKDNERDLDLSIAGDYLHHRTITTIAGLPARVSFWFTKNMLWKGSYSFLLTNIPLNMFLDNFEILKLSLSQKYGEPDRDTPKEVWHHPSYQNVPMSKETAVMRGYQSVFESWSDNETQIILSMTQGEDTQPIRILMSYISLRLKALGMAAQTRLQSDNLSTDGL